MLEGVLFPQGKEMPVPKNSDENGHVSRMSTTLQSFSALAKRLPANKGDRPRLQSE